MRTFSIFFYLIVADKGLVDWRTLHNIKILANNDIFRRNFTQIGKES